MSRSTFPQSIDQFSDKFDLPADKVKAAQELQSLKAKATLTADDQNRIQSLTAQLQDYMITPETMNRLQDAITELETFFDNNVRKYILQKQGEWDKYVDDFTFKGYWDANAQKYNRQNLVVYPGDGNLYIVLKNVTTDNNHRPNNTPDTYRQVAFKGDKGDVGLNANFRGEWNGSTAYKSGDAVCVRHGAPWEPTEMVFICHADNTGQKPNLDASDKYWFPYTLTMYGSNDPSSFNPHPDIAYIQHVD